MYSVYIHCKEKIGQGGGGCRKTLFSHSSRCLGLGLICPWHGLQALSVEIPSPKMIGLDNKYKSIIAQLKVSLELEGQRKDRGVGGWCKFVCV